MTLSDNLCRSWFDRLDVANTTINAFGDTVSETGSVVTTLMGAFRSSSQWIGALSATFGFVKGSADNIQRNYIVAADLGAVKYAVQSYRSGYRKEIEGAQAEWTYSNATSVLDAYVDTCSALSVRRFIARKLDPAPTVDNRIYEVALGKFLDDFKQAAANAKVTYPVADLSVDDLPLLYAGSFMATTLPEAVQTEIQAQMKAENITPLDPKAQSIFKTTAIRDAVLDRIVALAGQVATTAGVKAGQKAQAASDLQTAVNDAKAAAQPSAGDTTTLTQAMASTSPSFDSMIKGAPHTPPLGPQDVIALEAATSTDYGALDPAAKPLLAIDRPGLFDANGVVSWTNSSTSLTTFQAAVKQNPWSANLSTYVPKYIVYLKLLSQQKASEVEAKVTVPGRASSPENKTDDGKLSIWPIPQTPDGRPLNQPPPVTASTN